MAGKVAAKDIDGKKATEEAARRRRGGGFRAAGEQAAKILSPALRKRGFAHVEVLQRWPEIAGTALAANTRPERLWWPRSEEEGDGAVLHLLVASGWAVEVQHLEPMIIERVNRFFGWRAVTRLKLRQGQVVAPRSSRVPKQRPLTADEKAELDRSIAGVSDPVLKARLERLGSAIFAGVKR
jgi:hypothetical protein